MILFISPKDIYATRRVAEEAKAKGIVLECWDIKDLAEKHFRIDVHQYDALWTRQVYPFFNEMIHLAEQFKEQGKVIIDEQNILNGFETSRLWMYQQLEKKGIPIPKTEELVSLSTLNFSLSTKLVLKWNYGFGGKDVFLVHNEQELDQMLYKHSKQEWLVQEYIEADAEYEIYTVGYKALPKIAKFEINDNGFKANVNKAQIIDLDKSHSTAPSPYPLPGGEEETGRQLVQLAERSSKVLGRELAKVDIIQKGESLYVLEVNRTPSLLPFEPFTKLNIAGMFLDYIDERVKYKV